MRIVNMQGSADSITSERFLPSNWMKLVPMTELYYPLYRRLTTAPMGKGLRVYHSLLLEERNNEIN